VSEHIQARNTAEAFWTLDPLAVVKPGDPWFADIETMLPREHYGVSHKLKRHLGASRARPEFVHLALMGHAGMGKTTLARNALAQLAGDGLQPIFIDSLQAFDQSEFTFSDVMLIAAEAVLHHLADKQLEVGGAELEAVRQWFAEVLVIEEHRKQVLGSVEALAEGEVTVPFVAKLAAKVTAALKSDHEYRKEIRKRADRDPRELIRRVNVLLDAVHGALEPRKAKLCVVFDNLEKTNLELIDRALLQRADEFRQLRVNTLLFFNPASEYSPVGVQVSKVFTCVGVPALPVRFPNDAPSVVRPDAVKALEFMLSRRVLLEAVFDDPQACVTALAHWSGGHIRDVLSIARRAVENVEPKQVSVADIEHAGRWLGAGLTSSLEPGDLPRAVEVHRTHRVLDTKQDRRMLKNSCVLQYDGTQWWDVHPAVRADELFIEAAQKAANE
jgi:hypothetical protein